MGRKKSAPPDQWVKVGQSTSPPLTEEEYLRGRLGYVAHRTERPKVRTPAGLLADAEPPVSSGYFVSDPETEQRYADNTARGRVAWRKAHDAALWGLEVLEQGTLELAELYLRQAEAHMLRAYDAIVDDKQRARLGSSIKPAGRKPAPPSELTQRISKAMELQERGGLTGETAFVAALKADEKLDEDCRHLTSKAAVARVERLRSKKS